MATRPWHVYPNHDEATRKRPWDVMSASVPMEANTARGHIATFPDDRETGDWKRPRGAVQTETPKLWDTSVQTSLWLAQQNNLDSINATRDANSRTHQTRLSEEGYRSRNAGPPDQSLEWPRHSADVYKSSTESRRLELQHPTLSERPVSKFESPSQLMNSAASAATPDVATPQLRRPSMAPDMDHHCEKCFRDDAARRNPARSVSKLAESMLSGPMSHIVAQYQRENIRHEQIPLVAEVHRVFELVQEANGLAEHILQTAPSYLQEDRGSPSHDLHQPNVLHSSHENTKRRFLTDTQDGLKGPRRECVDVNYSNESNGYSHMAHESASTDPYARLLTVDVNGDRLPPIRTHTPSQVLADGFNTGLPSMKPPPTPGRQLPSPPSRSHPSPPSYSIPSPSSMLYGPQSTTSINAPPQQTLASILHPLSPTPSSSVVTNAGGTSTALQAHTAALQHEVSVKKYALQTLQSEHDKLLAALRRSQTRAHTLEEKQVSSDLEVNTLSEERVRLLAQIAELEQTIAEVSKTRDEFRQAAVKEGTQYVSIVRMASRLEMMAGDERKEWKRQINASNTKIDTLKASLGLQPPVPASDADDGVPFKALAAHDGSIKELKTEVQQLRTRCTEFEIALKAIRVESQRFGDAVSTLGSAGGQILASVDAALSGSEPAKISRTVSIKVASGPQLPDVAKEPGPGV